jgi:D-3-phosphoglycerate dehydrogenase / 2-oxoglutarate reductase
MKIVISDDYQDCVRSLDCYAKLKGFEVSIHHDTITDEEAIAERFADADIALLVRERTRITASLLDKLPKLKFISQTGRAANHVDLAACTQRGIPVAAEGSATHAASEMAWALLLAVSRRLITEVNGFKNGQWQTTLGVSLRGRTLGIAGYGKIGSVVAEYGKAFGMKVIVWGEREDSAQRGAEDGYEVIADRQAFFSRCDALSVHLRLSPSSLGLITAADLACMKKTAILINTSRSEVIASGALEQALSLGRPGFAGVDVYEREPIYGADHPLLTLPNVVCTPHIGYVEKDTYEEYFGFAIDQIIAWREQRPLNLLNPDMWEQRRR